MGHLDSLSQIFCFHGVTRIGHNLLQDFPTFGGVGLHDFEFFVGQFAGLVQNQVRNGNLADIVERRRALEPGDAFVSEFVRIKAFFLQLAGNSFHVCGRLLDVVTSTFVTGFHQFRKAHDDFILHAGNTFILCLYLEDIGKKIFGHGRERIVEVLDFVIGSNIYGLHTSQTNLAAYIGIMGKRNGFLGHPIDGNHYASFHGFGD